MVTQLITDSLQLLKAIKIDLFFQLNISNFFLYLPSNKFKVNRPPSRLNKYILQQGFRKLLSVAILLSYKLIFHRLTFPLHPLAVSPSPGQFAIPYTHVQQ